MGSSAQRSRLGSGSGWSPRRGTPVWDCRAARLDSGSAQANGPQTHAALPAVGQPHGPPKAAAAPPLQQAGPADSDSGGSGFSFWKKAGSAAPSQADASRANGQGQQADALACAVVRSPDPGPAGAAPLEWEPLGDCVVDLSAPTQLQGIISSLARTMWLHANFW